MLPEARAFSIKNISYPWVVSPEKCTLSVCLGNIYTLVRHDAWWGLVSDILFGMRKDPYPILCALVVLRILQAQPEWADTQNDLFASVLGWMLSVGTGEVQGWAILGLNRWRREKNGVLSPAQWHKSLDCVLCLGRFEVREMLYRMLGELPDSLLLEMVVTKSLHCAWLIKETDGRGDGCTLFHRAILRLHDDREAIVTFWMEGRTADFLRKIFDTKATPGALWSLFCFVGDWPVCTRVGKIIKQTLPLEESVRLLTDPAAAICWQSRSETLPHLLFQEINSLFEGKNVQT
jgi:hypothetical protein